LKGLPVLNNSTAFPISFKVTFFQVMSLPFNPAKEAKSVYKRVNQEKAVAKKYL